MAKKIKVLIPQYIKNFKCIGGECEDSCCIGWKVDIDKNTYKKYSNCRDEELKHLLSKKVTRNRSNPSDEKYAKIKMDDNLACPFLNEEKLCKIYSNLGGESLSVTCTTYPRVYNVVNNVLEK